MRTQGTRLDDNDPIYEGPSRSQFKYTASIHGGAENTSENERTDRDSGDHGSDKAILQERTVTVSVSYRSEASVNQTLRKREEQECPEQE